MAETKTHYRKAFDTPYLSSADIIEPTVLTISRAALESDKTKKSKDVFNTAYFEEREIRPGEKLKPMILNATNSKMLKSITGSPFLEDWVGVKVTVFVDKNVRFGKESVEGLRLAPARITKPSLTPDKAQAWNNAKAAYMRDGNLEAVMQRMDISESHRQQLIRECSQ